MIFLPAKNVLFLKAKKVAGTSFEIALSQFADERAIITPISDTDEEARQKLGFRGPQNYRFQPSELKFKKRVSVFLGREAPQKYFNHMSAKHMRESLGDEVFDNAFKISIVRNPFDKLVSQYFYVIRHQSDAPGFVDWIRQNPNMLNDNNDQFLIGETPVVDFFIRYERIDEDLKALEEQKPALKGIAKMMLSTKAKGGIRPQGSSASAMFNGHDDLISVVRFHNEFLIKKFGYELNA